MDHGTGTGRTARRTRRRGLWRAGTTGRTPGVPAARPEVDRSDDWFETWLTGAAEPRGVRHALASAGATGWTALHDLNRPGSAGATVPHVAVGPGGVVVLDDLRWTGDVTVADGTLRHRGYGRTTDVAAAVGTAGAVTALLAPAHRGAVRAVVCLAGRDLDPVPVRGGATVVGEAQLAEHLTTLPRVFTTEDVALVVEYLAGELGGSATPEQLTVDDVFRPAAVWAADPAGAAPSAARPGGTAPAGAGAGTRGRTDRATAAPDYAQPANHPVAGLHDEQPDADAEPPATAAHRPARGDGLLRVGVLVLGLLTLGNVLLAWLDAID